MNNSKIERDNICVLMGGNDLEMNTIRKICVDNEICFSSIGFSWSDSPMVSDYIDIIKLMEKDTAFIAIELGYDLDESYPIDIIMIDHHGDDGNKPSSIEQFLKLIGKKPTRYQQLVGMYDSGGILNLIKNAASQKEIDLIISDSFFIEDITEEKIQEAKNSVYKNHEKRRLTYFCHDLDIVKCTHSKTGPISLYMAKRNYEEFNQDYENLIIISDDGEINVFPNIKNGKLIIDFLNMKKYENSWYKISDKQTGSFWGCSGLSIMEMDKIVNEINAEFN